jgi:DNA-directed RNA polymerase specialized sigma24 family protein
VLQACEDRKLHEISTIIRCSLGATKTRLHRARARFRKVYQG